MHKFHDSINNGNSGAKVYQPEIIFSMLSAGSKKIYNDVIDIDDDVIQCAYHSIKILNRIGSQKLQFCPLEVARNYIEDFDEYSHEEVVKRAYSNGDWEERDPRRWLSSS